MKVCGLILSFFSLHAKVPLGKKLNLKLLSDAFIQVVFQQLDWARRTNHMAKLPFGRLENATLSTMKNTSMHKSYL